MIAEVLHTSHSFSLVTELAPDPRTGQQPMSFSLDMAGWEELGQDQHPRELGWHPSAALTNAKLRSPGTRMAQGSLCTRRGQRYPQAPKNKHPVPCCPSTWPQSTLASSDYKLAVFPDGQEAELGQPGIDATQTCPTEENTDRPGLWCSLEQPQSPET